MRTAVLTASLTTLFSELADGAKGGGTAFILNSGDAGLLRSIDGLAAFRSSGVQIVGGSYPSWRSLFSMRRRATAPAMCRKFHDGKQPTARRQVHALGGHLLIPGGDLPEDDGRSAEWV